MSAAPLDVVAVILGGGGIACMITLAAYCHQFPRCPDCRYKHDPRPCARDAAACDCCTAIERRRKR